MNYIIVILLIGFIILIHEAGHFLAARAVKIPIRIFSIGFGPTLWRIRRDETEYRICLLPLGGYVLPDVDEEDEFFAFPCNARIIMSIGGPAASLALPFLCFALMDVITSGFSLNSLFIKPAVQVFGTFHQMLVSLPLLFSQPRELSGIVGIVAQGGGFIGGNVVKALLFTALISVNLALLNLLPFPVLDGGKVMLYLLEKIHRPLKSLHYPLALAGWIVLIGLMLYVTVHDIGKLFT
ncbi:MAG: site-2 protease family protein [Vulcanimicrobiota bacterium]